MYLEHFQNVLSDYQDFFLRDVNTWNPKLKTDDMDKHFISFVKHVFCKYRVPGFLDQIWINYLKQYKQHIHKLQNNKNRKFLDWYICIGSGGSLYKDHTRKLGILSKKETANFLKYGISDLNIPQNIWFIKAISLGCNVGIAKNIAIVLEKYKYDEYYASVMRFFINNPIKLNEMSELFDFLYGVHEENENFSLKHRSLESIRVLSKEWHRVQAKNKHYKTLFWDGHAIMDWNYTDDKNNEWKMTQILSSKLLVAEGHAMRHCVASYASRCQSGHCSIWSLTIKHNLDASFKRAITIELKDDGSYYYLVQARGKINRLPSNQEKNIIKKWCYEHDVKVNYYSGI